MSPAGLETAPAPTRRKASLRRRVAALGYEILLITAVLFVAGFALLPFTPHAPETTRLEVPGAWTRGLSFAAFVAVLGGYCVGFWSGGRRTLAMKTWHLRLERRAGGALDPRTAVVRYAAAWIGPALALVAYLPLAGTPLRRWVLGLAVINIAWALVDRDRQYLHDRIAGTILIDDRPPRPAAQPAARRADGARDSATPPAMSAMPTRAAPVRVSPKKA